MVTLQYVVAAQMRDECFMPLLVPFTHFWFPLAQSIFAQEAEHHLWAKGWGLTIKRWPRNKSLSLWVSTTKVKKPLVLTVTQNLFLRPLASCESLLARPVL